MTTVLVVGAGFVGSHVAEHLATCGYDVRILSRTYRQHVTGDPEIDRRLEFIQGDCADRDLVADALRDATGICLCAGTTYPAPSNADPLFDLQTNLVTAVRFLDGIAGRFKGRLVYISSGGTVYGVPQTTPLPESHATEPLSAYGITRLCIEKYLALYHQLYGLDYVVLRSANPYGERQDPTTGQGAVAVFLDRVRRGATIEVWGDGSVVRDFLYVRDLAAAVRLAVERAGASRIYNVGTGMGTSLNELIRLIVTVAGRDVQVSYTPGRVFDAPANVLDISRIAAELGWCPATTLERGLERTWRWLEAGQAVAEPDGRPAPDVALPIRPATARTGA